MANILHIETSGETCSVALSSDGLCLTEEIDTHGRAHAAVLPGFVREVLSFADSHALPLDAVAISSGPGSYTGLRIGLSMAKGLCYARDLKLLAVPTLQLLCTPVLLQHDPLPDDALLCPMIDARRMEVYTALYDRALHPVEDVHACVVEPGWMDTHLIQHPIYFLGSGAGKCRDILTHPNAHFLDNIRPLARHMFPLAELALARGRTEDVAYFTPFYLKDFVPGRAKDPFGRK